MDAAGHSSVTTVLNLDARAREDVEFPY